MAFCHAWWLLPVISIQKHHYSEPDLPDTVGTAFSPAILTITTLV